MSAGRIVVGGVKLTVKLVQTLLVGYGANVIIDGIWGYATQHWFGKTTPPQKQAIKAAVEAQGETPWAFIETLNAAPRDVGSLEVAMISDGDKYGVTGVSLANLLATCCAESSFKPRDEECNYSPAAARSRFDALKSASDADIYELVAKGPKAFFEVVYGRNSSMGKENLGNVAAGDGGKYYGRGVLQITGRANYAQFEKDTGWPVLSRPEMMNRDDVALTAAFWYWARFVQSRGADKDIRKASKVVNAGLSRKELSERAVLAGLYANVVV